MNNSHFEFIRDFIFEHVAIVLEPGKEYLVESRLTPLAKSKGFSSLEELIEEFKYKPQEVLKLELIDAMTTNETLFFRDISPFETLKQIVLPSIIENKQSKVLNIWSAASSSGQEAYSIAMMIQEHFGGLPGWSINIIGSDISEKMVRKAKSGIYNQIEVNRGLPMSFLLKYFEKRGNEWHLKLEIKNMVNFQMTNLKNEWEISNQDVIFLRNVLIYFDIQTKKDVLRKIHQSMHPHGSLFLGGAETTRGLSDDFERITQDKMSFYKVVGHHKSEEK